MVQLCLDGQLHHCYKFYASSSSSKSWWKMGLGKSLLWWAARPTYWRRGSNIWPFQTSAANLFKSEKYRFQKIREIQKQMREINTKPNERNTRPNERNTKPNERNTDSYWRKGSNIWPFQTSASNLHLFISEWFIDKLIVGKNTLAFQDFQTSGWTPNVASTHVKEVSN